MIRPNAPFLAVLVVLVVCCAIRVQGGAVAPACVSHCICPTVVTGWYNCAKRTGVMTYAGAFPSYDFFSSAASINLGFNEINALAAASLVTVPAVTFLSLSSNPVATIEDGCFDQTPMLNSLFLSSTSLSTLSAKVFWGLQKLTVLDLSNTRLGPWLETTPNVFQYSSSILTLNLANIYLSIIKTNMLSSLVNLMSIDLSQNSIGGVQPNSFMYMNINSQLNMAGNPTTCKVDGALSPQAFACTCASNYSPAPRNSGCVGTSCSCATLLADVVLPNGATSMCTQGLTYNATNSITASCDAGMILMDSARNAPALVVKPVYTCMGGHWTRTPITEQTVYECLRDACIAKPCANGGLCAQSLTAPNYVCNCSGTGYTGATCRSTLAMASSSSSSNSDVGIGVGVGLGVLVLIIVIIVVVWRRQSHRAQLPVAKGHESQSNDTTSVAVPMTSKSIAESNSNGASSTDV